MAGSGLCNVFSKVPRLAIDGYQLLLGSGDHGRSFGCFRGRFGVERVKYRGANENGKEKGYNVHSCAEQEGLPAANCGKSSSIHWILELVFKRLRIPKKITDIKPSYNEIRRSLFWGGE